MKIILAAAIAVFFSSFGQGQTPASPTQPDPRFKADVLVVVAHPDDESEIGAFLAKAAFDDHRRIAVVFGTRGNSGGNAVGQEQAATLGAIREIEGRRALAYLGITDVWFLDGPDTPGQDVLRSLETWDHGRALDRLVRIVRLTRPSVIATWLPAYTAGENHGDHQAAGVLATEAFDIAGDPTQFPEQVTPPRDATSISNLTEGLHTWQAEKLYYFSDASHFEFLKGRGPEYSASAVSPSKNKSYAQLSAEECSFHLTQSDSGYLAKVSLEKNELDKTYFREPSRFILGKSHVDASTTGDVFEAVKPGSLPYMAAPGYKYVGGGSPTLELGGPWHFYRQFWAVHGLNQLLSLVPPEVEAGVKTPLRLPILIQNPGTDSMDAEIQVKVPAGWTLYSGAGKLQVAGGDTASRQIVAIAPTAVQQDWKDVIIRATAAGKPIGEVTVRVQVVPFSLPQ